VVVQVADPAGVLPDDILWRQKEQFSDGVGYSWIDSLKAFAEREITDSDLQRARWRFEHNPPQTKEAYLYRVLFTGALEHRHLRHLWPLADVSVTPSVFPEAFGMVAAEAAACGSPPLVARHSGLAEVAEGLEAAYPEEHRGLASFAPGDAADLAAKLGAILALPGAEWDRLSSAARAAAVERWSWDTIAALILSPRG